MDPAPGLFKPGAGFLRDEAGEWAATASLSERGRVKNIQKDLARLRKFVEFAKTSVKCIQLHGIIKAVQHVQPKECMRKA